MRYARTPEEKLQTSKRRQMGQASSSKDPSTKGDHCAG